MTITATIEAGAFRKALSTLARHSECREKSKVPILSCVCLEGGPDGLTVAHYGIDMSVAISIDGTAKGDVAVPLRPLLAFMSGADGKEVTIAPHQNGERIRFDCGAFSATIIPMKRSDAPEIPPPSGNAEDFRRIMLAEGVMKWLFDLTLPFVSSEETRYYLNGVCLEIGHKDDGMVRAVATDGHRLASRQHDLPKPVQSREAIIVPRFAVAAVLALTGDAEVEMSIGSGKADFRFGRTVLRTKLIDGTFPDWRRVVPPGPFKEMELNADKAKRFATAIGGGTLERYRSMKIEPCTGGIRLSSKDPDIGEVAAELPCKIDDEFPTIGLNPCYMSDIAKAFGSKTLRIGASDSGAPMLIERPDAPLGEFAVLMPMRV